MIAHLRGMLQKMSPGEVTIDVHGVGYRVSVPLSVWETIAEDSEVQLWTSAYVREDRFDLYGFADEKTRHLFEALISRQGIGPTLGIALCDVSRSILAEALSTGDASILTSIKGVGKKTAEKLLIELRSLAEKDPGYFLQSKIQMDQSEYDRDAVAALSQLGYAMHDILRALGTLPASLATTEERVTSALRSL